MTERVGNLLRSDDISFLLGHFGCLPQQSVDFVSNKRTSTSPWKKIKFKSVYVILYMCVYSKKNDVPSETGPEKVCICVFIYMYIDVMFFVYKLKIVVNSWTSLFVSYAGW